MSINKQRHTLKVEMSNKELDFAIWEIVKSGEFNESDVYADGDIHLNGEFTPK